MKLWLGHYLGAPHEWFVAWGETKMEAAAHVGAEWAEPDLRSMRIIESPGAINFRVEVGEDEDGEERPVYLNTDSGEEELSMSLGTDEGYEENDAWILERLQAPLPELLVRAAGAAGAAVGVRQEALLRAVVEGDGDEVPDCACFWERDVLNGTCEQYEPSPAATGQCVVCEHGPACHPVLGVRR